MRRFDKGPCYMEENDEGKYVLHSDHAAELTMVEWQRDANRRMLNKALTENALLRAECEAWRKNDDQYDDADESNTLWKAAYKARAATDEAGALKGVRDA